MFQQLMKGIWPVLLLCCINFVACENDQITEPQNHSSEIPFTVGSEWMYSVYDSLNSASDTVKVVIVGSASLSGGTPATVWQYEFRDRSDSLFVGHSGDTITFYFDKQHLQNQKIMFILPLQVGSSWGTQYRDTVSVLTKGSVEVPAGTFYNSYLVQQQSLMPNDLSVFKYWIEPYIGIVRMFERVAVTVDWPYPQAVNMWELISYEIAN